MSRLQRLMAVVLLLHSCEMPGKLAVELNEVDPTLAIINQTDSYDSYDLNDTGAIVSTTPYQRPVVEPSPPTVAAESTTLVELSNNRVLTNAVLGDPTSCEGFCPNYTLVDKRPEYELRSYPASLWVSTFILSDNRVLAELQGFAKLNTYMAGVNDRGLVVNATIPMVTQIKYRNNPGVWKESNDYTLSLFLPSALGSDPPYPMTSEILIDSVETRLVFVQRFKAWLWEMTDRHVRARATRMMTVLQNGGEAFLSKYVYLATYMRPQLYNQTEYELWLFASRYRDPTRLRPRVKSADPPLSRLTAKTRKRICRGLECPRFDVLRSYKYGIQKRRYYDSKFASFSPDDCEFTRAGLWRGFMPLHLYKHGVNSHLEILEATRPIGILHMKENDANFINSNNSICPLNFTVALYLPERLHTNPPTTGPQGPRIRISLVDDLVVYVHTVGGYILEPDRIGREMKRFTKRLRQFDLCFVPAEYYVAVYDFIVRFHGRLNEIWLIASSCPGANANDQTVGD